MAAAHKGKALVLRWLGARQRLYLERRIRRDSASISNIVLGYFYILLISSSSCFLQIKVPTPEKCPKKVIRDTCPSITYYFAKYYVILCKVS